MNKQELINQIKEKKSFLCIGLDTDSAKIPKHLLSFDDPVFEFNKRIICLLYTSPSPRDKRQSRMPSSA